MATVILEGKSLLTFLQHVTESSSILITFNSHQHIFYIKYILAALHSSTYGIYDADAFLILVF